MNLKDLAELKRTEREMWARGDYGAIARDMFWEAGARIVERLDVSSGERVLDVACGTGNAALRAAKAGARVVALDLTPELLEAGRRLAVRGGLEVEWVEGDAETMPFEDASFDVVLSTFGCMFAPRHEVAAGELVRVLRPGGRIGLCSWTPQSAIADLMRTLFAYLPPTGEGFQPPALWGSEDHVRELFAPTGIELGFEQDTLYFRFGSVEQALRTFETKWGPFMEARELLAPEGRWESLRAELAGVLERHDVASGHGLVFAGEYLVVTGQAVDFASRSGSNPGDSTPATS